MNIVMRDNFWSWSSISWKVQESSDELHNDLPIIPERMEIEKNEKLVAILYVIHVRNLKQALTQNIKI